MKTKWLSCLLAVSLLLGLGWVQAEEVTPEAFPIYLNGESLDGAAPIRYQHNAWSSELLIPYVLIMQKLGFVTTYDAETDSVTSVKDDVSYHFTNNQNRITVTENGETYTSWYGFLTTWNGRLYVNQAILRHILGTEVFFDDQQIQLYDPDSILQAIQPQFRDLNAFLELIPNLQAYQCSGTVTATVNASSDLFGIHMTGGAEGSLFLQRNGDECLATCNLDPKGLLNLSFIESHYDSVKDDWLTSLKTPVWAGAYQNQDGIYVLADHVEEYDLQNLIPSLSSTYNLYAVSRLDPAFKKGWVQLPDSRHGVFPNRLRLLQVAKKETWDTDYLMRQLVETAIDWYGQQGYTSVNCFLSLSAKLLSAPYLSVAQSPDGSLQFSYQLTSEEYDAALKSSGLSREAKDATSLLSKVKPNIQYTMNFSDTNFSIDGHEDATMTGLYPQQIVNDVVDFTIDTQLSGTIGAQEINRPQVITTDMLEEQVAALDAEGN